MSMLKVLFIAHYFPPIGGGGVQRSAKFVKRLPEFGIIPLVLTGCGKSVDRWSPLDDSLLGDIPSDVPVFRASWENRNHQPIPREELIRRRHSALAHLADRVIRTHRPSVIFVTLSPFEDAYLAATLARRHGLPWIADLRDPWALDEFQIYRTRWHRWRERRRMAQALESAQSVILNTPEAANRFRTAFPALAAKARIDITNGFDEADFSDPPSSIRNDTFTIVHAGSMYTGTGLRQQRCRLLYRLLGRTEPGMEILPRSHYYLLRALEQWLAEDPRVGYQVRALFLGVPTAADEALAQASPARSLLQLTGYVPHLRALRFVRNADLLFLPLHKIAAKHRATIVPGKTYEYLATGLPVLAALPPGDAKDFLERAGTGLFCEPDDVATMLGLLQTQFRAWQLGRQTVDSDRQYVQRFERRRLTQSLAAEIYSIALSSAGSPSIPTMR